MASEPTSQQDDRLEAIKARIDDLEAELGEKFEKGKAAATDLTDDIRMRIDEFRDGDRELSGATVEELESKVDELTAELDEEIDEGRETVATILDDVKRQVRELAEKLRSR